MENMKPKHKIYDRPYLGAIVGFILAVFWTAAIPQFLARPIAEANPGSDPAFYGYLLTVVFTLLGLLIHRQWFRKDGYKGTCTYSKSNQKDVWLGILVFLVLDVILFIIGIVKYDGEGPRVVMPSLFSIAFALNAGFFEEVATRGIPVSIMLKNKPDYKRMWIAVIASSIVFGIMHMGNAAVGQSVFMSAFQTFIALCMGLFFVAIYVRTGNIFITIALHALHDQLAFMYPEQATGIMTQTTIQFQDVIVCIVLVAAAVYMLRKSKWEEIQATWANIWNE